jgi:hypothetical protein
MDADSLENLDAVHSKTYRPSVEYRLDFSGSTIAAQPPLSQL